MIVPTRSLSYPDAPREHVIDEYHGVKVADPYRWLEDADTPQSRAWIAAQDALVEGYLDDIPARERIRERLTAVWNYERFGIPSRVGSHYAYAKNAGLQNQAVITIAPRLGEDERVLIDPNALSPDGTVALNGLSFTLDGSRLAYATSASGSDWMTWRIRDVASGIDLPDEIAWSKFSGAAWLVDGSGFFYCRYAAPDATNAFKSENYGQMLYFHRVGTSQADDELIYERPDHRDWNFGATTSEDGRWLVIDVSHGSDPNNRVFLKDLQAAGTAAIEMLPEADAAYAYLGNDGETFYFRTTKDAPRGRVVAIAAGDRSLREIVAESADALQSASLFGDRLVLEYLHDARSVVRRYALDGAALGDLALPGIGTASGFGGHRADGETFFAYTSYTTPTSIYRLEVATGETSLVFAPTVPFASDAFVSEQVFYRSKDGTAVPMIVTARRDVPRDGTTPTILYGYGGFDISVTPAFSPAILVWLELGGAYAVPNIRGGGEYGEQWHLAGTKERKQNVFDDFIAAADYLIANRYTSRDKLAIAGGSNGGLLVGACMTQRPDLFGAALPAVGVLDMLRFQKFTIGWAWTADYGCSDDADAFEYLYAYSPYHRIVPGTAYPPTLITTADHDDRVFPAHSFKFAAALQAAQGGPAPILIRIETKAGHGAGKPTAKVIDEAADRYAFLVRALDMHHGEIR